MLTVLMLVAGVALVAGLRIRTRVLGKILIAAASLVLGVMTVVWLWYLQAFG